MLLEASTKSGVESESCILSAYCTTTEQIHKLLERLYTNTNNEWFSVHWEVEIADEWNGWFAGIATAFCDFRKSVRVCIPGSYEGEVLLDWRVIRLVNCLDNYSKALYNKIVRDNVLSMQWDVDWFDPSSECWIRSTACYYFTIVNKILIKDTQQSYSHIIDDTNTKPKYRRQYVCINVDQTSLRLHFCHDKHSRSIFETLIFEESIKCTSEARKLITTKTTSYVNNNSSIFNRSRYCNKKLTPTMHESVGYCVVCLEQPVGNVAYVPCGHQVLCNECENLSAMRRRDKQCPVCRQTIVQRLTIYRV
jgi:hypothetical protein